MLQTYREVLEKIYENRKSVWSVLHDAENKLKAESGDRIRADKILTHVFGVIGEAKPQVSLLAEQTAKEKALNNTINSNEYIRDSEDLDWILEYILQNENTPDMITSKIVELARLNVSQKVQEDILWTAIAVCVRCVSDATPDNRDVVLKNMESYYERLHNSLKESDDRRDILKEQMAEGYYSLYLMLPADTNAKARGYYAKAYEYWDMPEETTDEAFLVEKGLAKAYRDGNLEGMLKALEETELSVSSIKIRQYRREIIKQILEQAGKVGYLRKLEGNKDCLFRVAKSLEWDLSSDYSNYEKRYRLSEVAQKKEEQQRLIQKQKAVLDEYFSKKKYLHVLPVSYRNARESTIEHINVGKELERSIREKVAEVPKNEEALVSEEKLHDMVKQFFAYIVEGKNENSWNVDRIELADEYILDVYNWQVKDYIQKYIKVSNTELKVYYECVNAKELKDWLQNRTKGERGYLELAQEELLFCVDYIKKIIRVRKQNPTSTALVQAPEGASYYAEDMKIRDFVIPWSLAFQQLIYVSGFFGLCNRLVAENPGAESVVLAVPYSVAGLIMMIIANAIEGGKIRKKMKKRISKAYIKAHLCTTIMATVGFAGIMLLMGEDIWLVMCKLVMATSMYLGARVGYWFLKQ